MEWLTQLKGRIVGLDTAPLIYFMEQNQAYIDLVLAFFQAMSQSEFKVVTSTLTLTEVLVHPLRSFDSHTIGDRIASAFPIWYFVGAYLHRIGVLESLMCGVKDLNAY